MIKIIPVALFFLSFFASLVANAILRRISIKKRFLIDSPDMGRKLHKEPTPLTGGIAISVGLLFSCFFLYFISDASYELNIKYENFISFEESLDEEEKSSFKLGLDNGDEIYIERYGTNGFTVTFPSGEKRLYRVSSEINNSYEILQDAKNKRSISLDNFSIGLIVFTIIIQVFMIFDDMWNLKASSRIFIQILGVSGLIFVSGVYLQDFGNLLGFGDINLGIFGIPITIFCVVGAMNAFNMIDGLNGLCASLCLVCFSSIIIMSNTFSTPSLFPLILPVGAIMGFLMYNLGLFGEKRTVFLGDNGSNALGFLCAWILIYYNENDIAAFSSPTALWLIAVPLVDAIHVIFSRLVRGSKPFEAGRDHIHHTLQDLGFDNSNVYRILIIVSILVAFFGLLLNNIFYYEPYIPFYCFLILAIMYFILSKRYLNRV